MRITIITILFVLLIATHALAQHDIVFINGDHIHGQIVSENTSHITLSSEVLGEITLRKEVIESMKARKPALPDEESKKEIEWIRIAKAGYNITDGNTETSAVSTSLEVNRKTKDDETTFKGNYNESASNDTMDSQLWYTLARYAYSFGKELKWYHFFKNEADHDKFANIDYRIIPASGIGYWFSDELPFVAMAEIGVGWEFTTYNNGTEDSNEAVLIPRALIEWNVVGDAILSEEFTYPSVSDFGEYRFTSITTFSNPISEHLSAEIAMSNKYNSNPAEAAEKNDMMLSSALVVSFWK